MSNYKVFISAGHGGNDSGAIGNGFKEKDLNLKIALPCVFTLTRFGVNTLISRTKDENDPINDEARESNAFNPNLSVSIHNNAGGGDGVEAWYSVVGGLSKTCAENILSEVTKIGQNSRGAKCKRGAFGKDYYGFIRQTKAPAVIVECAFIDNATDIEIVNTDEKCAIMGTAIAYGILKTLGISTEQPTSNVTPITATSPIPTVAPTEPARKSNEQVAQEVINGEWGNGVDRATRLARAGYDYPTIQGIVNSLVKSTPIAPPRVSNNEIASQVLRGVWGNGSERKKRLESAGYNYAEIQKIVNQMCRK